MLSGGYIKYDSANKSIAPAMQFSIYCSQPNAYKLRVEGRRIDMDEIMFVYYTALSILACLSIIQAIRELIKDLHDGIRSLHQKRRSKRK